MWFGGFEVISSCGVCDDQDFSHDGGEGDFSGTMIGFDEAIVEVLLGAEGGATALDPVLKIGS